MLDIGEMDFSSNSILPDPYHYWVHQSRSGVVNDDDDIDIAELIWASQIIVNDIGNVTGNSDIGDLIWASPNTGRSPVPHPFRLLTAVPAAFTLQIKMPFWCNFDDHP